MISAGGGAEESVIARTRSEWKTFRDLLFVLAEAEHRRSWYCPQAEASSMVWPCPAERRVDYESMRDGCRRT